MDTRRSTIEDMRIDHRGVDVVMAQEFSYRRQALIAGPANSVGWRSRGLDCWLRGRTPGGAGMHPEWPRWTGQTAGTLRVRSAVSGRPHGAASAGNEGEVRWLEGYSRLGTIVKARTDTDIHLAGRRGDLDSEDHAFARLLKKVRLLGGTTHPTDGHPGAERGVLQVRRSERASARGTRPEDGSPQMGLFQQPASGANGSTRPV